MKCIQSSMLAWLARRVVKDAWFVVITWVVLSTALAITALTGWGGGGLFSRLEAGSASIPGTESATGQQVLDSLAGDSVPVTLLVRGVDLKGTEHRERIVPALAKVHEELAAMSGVEKVVDPFLSPGALATPAAQALVSKNLDSFLIVVTVNPKAAAVVPATDTEHSRRLDDAVDAVETRLMRVPGELHDVEPSATGIVSHKQLVTDSITNQTRKDLVTGEMIAMPVALMIMVLVFGGLLAASMPLVGALASVACTLGALYLLSLGTPLQSFVVNIASVLGLGLSIDYALLMTSRYREELARAYDAGNLPDAADGRPPARRRDPLVVSCMTTTILTAGRTVVFSAVTIAISLFGLSLMGGGILRSIGLAGAVVVLIAVAAAVTLIPAVLVLLGQRVARPSVLERVPLLGGLLHRIGDVSRERGVFAALARWVHARPWTILTACLAVLTVLALPVLRLHTISSTVEQLPADSSQRVYAQTLSEDYPAVAGQDATVIIRGPGERISAFINDEVASLPGVEAVLGQSSAEGFTVVHLDLTGDEASTAAERAVSAIRALKAPADMRVTGQAADQIDFRETVDHGLPLTLGAILVATFVLLFLMTGSLLIPVKALIVNALSLAASMGVLVWVFQNGHGSGLLGFTPLGGLETAVVVTAATVGFGLAMDYEVFLLARITEYRRTGRDNDTSVELGLQRSGRVVTFAALIMVAVFLGFVSGKLIAVKEIGLALAVIVALDASIVRMLLVPATMTLLGEWNWWSPCWLQRLLAGSDADADPASTARTTVPGSVTAD